ncbi:MAG: hypothetical protein GX829_12375 [Clostridium sp.]|nr:hypothetical protein [Clostridium sp.]
MSLSNEEKAKFMKIIEEKKNKKSIIESKQRAATSLGAARKGKRNKKTGGVFDK